jgi:hypothetical protein
LPRKFKYMDPFAVALIVMFAGIAASAALIA